MITVNDRRSEVQTFAIAMEEKLRTKDAERGGSSWKTDHAVDLLTHLDKELDELTESMIDAPVSVSNVKDECVDVANMAMMIFDVAETVYAPTPCPICKQMWDETVTGEHPCPECGMPTVHDAVSTNPTKTFAHHKMSTDPEGEPKMQWFEFTCDRCHQTKKGGLVPGVATSGYYDVSKPETPGTHNWSRYSNPGEEKVCDDCMHKDARYMADYGGRPAGPARG